MRILTIVVLTAIALGATLLLLTDLGKVWWAEWLILMAAGLFILAMFFGLWVEAEWGYPLATILFALSLANMLWLYTKTHSFTVFALGMLANIIGMVVSITGIGKPAPDTEKSLETYDDMQKPEKKKRGRPKKR